MGSKQVSTLCARSLGLGLPCPAPLSCSQEPAQTRMSNVWRRRPTSFGAPAVASILCWSCGAHLTGASLGSHLGHVNGTPAVVERVCAEPPLIMPSWAKPLGRSFVVSSTTFSNCLPGTQARAVPTVYRPAESASCFQKRDSCDRRGTHSECGSSLGTEWKKRQISRGLTLWLRVLALLAQREAEWIKTASDLWPSALRQRLNLALYQHERSRSLPLLMYFNPGRKNGWQGARGAAQALEPVMNYDHCFPLTPLPPRGVPYCKSSEFSDLNKSIAAKSSF